MILNQTDQTQCFNDTGGIIPCSGTGQDGEIRSGMQWPEPRFTGTGRQDTVTDQLTGLVWPRDAGLSEFPLSWQEAFDFVNDMNIRNMFGLNRWRLPERTELFSLISHAQINPAVVAPDQFHTLFNGYYWTATPCARYPRQAWYIHLGGGRIVKGMIHGSYMVWPVHDLRDGSQCVSGMSEPAEIRFQTSQHIVSDLATGLTWLRDADVLGKTVTWTEALSHIHRMNSEKWLGFQDWRLPNIRELESLTDMTLHSPAIAARDWFKSIRPFYWSATTSVYEPSYAWTLYSEDGNIGVGFKPGSEFHVWPVRDGKKTI